MRLGTREQQQMVYSCRFMWIRGSVVVTTIPCVINCLWCFVLVLVAGKWWVNLFVGVEVEMMMVITFLESNNRVGNALPQTEGSKTNQK